MPEAIWQRWDLHSNLGHAHILSCTKKVNVSASIAASQTMPKQSG